MTRSEFDSLPCIALKILLTYQSLVYLWQTSCKMRPNVFLCLLSSQKMHDLRNQTRMKLLHELSWGVCDLKMRIMFTVEPR